MFPKFVGDFTPKMDGENNGRPELQIQDLGGKNPPIFGNTHTQMLNVWPIYLQNWVVLGVNVGK